MRRFGPSPIDIFAGCLVLVVILAVTLLPVLHFCRALLRP